MLFPFIKSILLDDMCALSCFVTGGKGLDKDSESYKAWLFLHVALLAPLYFQKDEQRSRELTAPACKRLPSAFPALSCCATHYKPHSMLGKVSL